MSFINKQVKSTAGYCLSSICNWWYQGELGFCCREAEPCINVYGHVWLYICTKLASRCLNKIKLPPGGLELTTLTITDLQVWCRHPNVLSRHVLTISDFQILMKSCSIESRNDPSPKKWSSAWNKIQISYSTHVCLGHLDRHQTCKLVMAIVVSLSPTGGNFIF